MVHSLAWKWLLHNTAGSPASQPAPKRRMQSKTILLNLISLFPEPGIGKSALSLSELFCDDASDFRLRQCDLVWEARVVPADRRCSEWGYFGVFSIVLGSVQFLPDEKRRNVLQKACRSWVAIAGAPPSVQDVASAPALACCVLVISIGSGCVEREPA